MDLIFNPSRDIQAVSQVCLPSLGQIMESGIIPQDAGEILYNDVENPDSVVGLMRDNFDFADAARIAESVTIQDPISPTPSTPASSPDSSAAE